MQKHIKNYLKTTGKCIEDIILCEYCGAVANDIHHIIYRSHGGSDDFNNLVALCRGCHSLAHNGGIPKDDLLDIRKGLI